MMLHFHNRKLFPLKWILELVEKMQLLSVLYIDLERF